MCNVLINVYVCFHYTMYAVHWQNMQAFAIDHIVIGYNFFFGFGFLAHRTFSLYCTIRPLQWIFRANYCFSLKQRTKNQRQRKQIGIFLIIQNVRHMRFLTWFWENVYFGWPQTVIRLFFFFFFGQIKSGLILNEPRLWLEIWRNVEYLRHFMNYKENKYLRKLRCFAFNSQSLPITMKT